MQRVVLLISRDEDVLRARAQRHKTPGFRAVSVPSLRLAVSLVSVRQPRVVVLCQTFEITEQEVFIDELHETHPEIHVLCLRPDAGAPPSALLFACVECFKAQPGTGIVRVSSRGLTPDAVSDLRIGATRHHYE